PHTSDEAPSLQPTCEDRDAALMHGEGARQPARRHPPAALQGLEGPQLRPGQPVGSPDVLRVRLEGLHNPAQALNDLSRIGRLLLLHRPAKRSRTYHRCQGDRPAKETSLISIFISKYVEDSTRRKE